MKKLIALGLSIICVALLLSTTNIRLAQGAVTGTMYFEEGDYTNATLTTTDGEAWIVENYVAPLGDKVLVIYDRCSKDTIYDDEILYIIHFTPIS
jgi:hypothetical protein